MRLLGSALLAVTVAVAVLLPGCVSAELPDEGPGDGADDAFLAGGKADGEPSDADLAGVLRLVAEASEEELDLDVGLDARAAAAIVAHRDVEPIETIEELDAIAWVGPIAFEKLLAYARANGYVDGGDTGGGAPCLIISEYTEGSGNYNKAIELYNCGAAPVALAEYHVCLVRDSATTCTVDADLGTATLAAGEVFTVCRRQSYHPNGLDPIPFLAEACDLERAGAMTFSGDDRILVMRGPTIVDAIGRVGYKPAPSTWANVDLRRCDFTPADGVSYYDHTDYFTSRSGNSVTDFGVAPVAGCP